MQRCRDALVGLLAATLALSGCASSDPGSDPAPATSSSRSSDASAPASRPAPTDAWKRIAESPLAGRANAVGVWTGAELIIAGGDGGPVCPALADCALVGTPSAEAAAYDPETDSWRALPPAPAAFASGFGIWLGDRALIVTADSQTLLLEPETDTWTRGPDLPTRVTDGGLVRAGDNAIRFSYDSRGNTVTDYRFDGQKEIWEPLPRDPFGESYDRSIASFDGRLWLLSMPVENHSGAYEGQPSRLAVLEGDRWQVVDPETPDMTQRQWILPQGDLLVAAENRDPAARNWTYNPQSNKWTQVLPLDDGVAGCYLRNPAAGPSWITAGNRLVSVLPEDALPAPPCPGHADFKVVAWAGDRLILWGGVATEASSKPTNDGLVWVPRQPT